METDPDAAFLGKVLRRARIQSGVRSQEELAERFGYDRTVINRAESGHRISAEVAHAYAQAFPELNALVQSGLIEEWAEHVRQNGGSSFPKSFGKWVDAEVVAATLFYWAPTLVPGILQTESYARAMLATTPSDEPLEIRLADRMGRQEILTRAQPPVVTAVISEAVLHRRVGGPEVMHEQLSYLADLPYPKVMIQVIPADIAAHAGLEGAASISEREGGPAIVYLDSLTAAQTTGEPEKVARVREITAILHSEALPRGASRELILKVAEECKP